MTVAGESDSARQLYSLVETEKPDLVISELMLADTDSISAARELHRRRLTTRMMLLTMYNNPLFVSDALDAGIAGYVLKDQPLAEVIAAVRAVAAGETYVSPALAKDLPLGDRKQKGCQRRGGWPGAAVSSRARGVLPDHPGTFVPGDRRRPLHQREDGRDPSDAHQPEAGRALAGRADPAGSASGPVDR